MTFRQCRVVENMDAVAGLGISGGEPGCLYQVSFVACLQVGRATLWQIQPDDNLDRVRSAWAGAQRFQCTQQGRLIVGGNGDHKGKSRIRFALDLEG